jgi:flagellar protein FliO/FliZ
VLAVLAPLAAALLSAPPTAPLPGSAPAAAGEPAAPASAPAPELHLPRSGLDAGALAAPAALLAGLGAAAFLLARRRRAPGRRVQVLETTSLGPKRSLVLARLRDEVLLLGASEAGIVLLRTQPAADLELDAAPDPAPAPAPRAADRAPAALSDLVARLRRGRPDRASARFESLLVESAEDQELRRKLARGQAGSVR